MRRPIGHDMQPHESREFVNSPCPILLEIGCNDGTDTNRLLETFPGGTVYCFEPDPRAVRRFCQTVHNDRARLAQVAISDTDGEAVFYGSSGRPPLKARGPSAPHYCHLDEWDLSGSLCKPTGHLEFSPWTTFPKDRQYVVQTMRLDTWMGYHPSIGIVDFIWCDVQGAEALVIRGAPFTLARTRYFYTEFYDRPLYEGQLPLAELREMLPDFDLQGIHGDNALFRNRGLTCPKSQS